MTRTGFILLTMTWCAVCWCRIGMTETLTQEQLDEFIVYQNCVEKCEKDLADDRPAALRDRCFVDCGQPERLWEKNLVPPVDRDDLFLANLEFNSKPSDKLVCYDEKGAVKPIELCEREECVANRGETACSDSDGDGLLRWQEDELGTSDSAKDDSCLVGLDCGTCEGGSCTQFSQRCEYDGEAQAAVCRERECAAEGACSAFHLETISQSNDEVIVHVHYDYSPVPARILDFTVSFDAPDLELVDARPLPLLKAADHELMTKTSQILTTDGSVSAQNVRLVMISTGSREPLPMGALVELVFVRHSREAVDIKLLKNGEVMSPDMGEELRDAFYLQDELWGGKKRVQSIGAASTDGPQLILHYAFDDPTAPLLPDRFVPTAETLCQVVPDCRDLDAGLQKAKRAKEISFLQTLQRGIATFSQSVEGVSGKAAYLDGSADHLRLPIWPRLEEVNDVLRPQESDYSLTAWFAVEGVVGGHGDVERQVLFSRNTKDGQTAFGLVVQLESLSDTADLYWFKGSIRGAAPEQVLLRSDIDLFTWHQAALSFDAGADAVRVYWDGELIHSTSLALNQGERYPDIVETLSRTQIQLAKLGDDQSLYYASSINGKAAVSRYEMSGYRNEEVIAEAGFSAQEPNYNPITDKIVYSSNASGNYEIWIADRDGSHQRQVTKGFGNTAFDIFARRPRWQPNGRGIVFESNARTSIFNSYGVSVLYFIPYNPVEDVVEVTLDGSRYDQLNFDELLGGQNLHFFGLGLSLDNDGITSVSLQNMRNASWIQGEFTDENTGQERWGTIVYNTSSLWNDSWAVATRDIAPINGNIAKGQHGDARTLSLPESPVEESRNLERKLLAASSPEYGRIVSDDFEPDAGATAPVREIVVAEQWRQLEGGALPVELTWDPATYEAVLTYRGEPDQYEMDSVLIAHEGCDLDKESDHRGAWLETKEGLVKELQVEERLIEDRGREYQIVRVGLLSPTAKGAIPAGAEIARVGFENCPESVDADDFELFQDAIHQRISVVDVTAFPQEKLSIDPKLLDFEMVVGAAISPDKLRQRSKVAFSGISNARPALHVFDREELDACAAEGRSCKGVIVSTLPRKALDLTWTKQERYYPATWIGAYLDPVSKLYATYDREKMAYTALRGRIDELKVYNYVREPGAIASDYFRGDEWLEAKKIDGRLEPVVGKCFHHTDCPEFSVCLPRDFEHPEDKSCQVVGCADDPSICPVGSACEIAPVSLAQAENENLSGNFAARCVAECYTDSNCYDAECANGPCGFCDASEGTCFECKDDEEVIAIAGQEISIPKLRGCPDANSYFCYEGSCASDCYEFVNGTAQYLCDPATEYCNKGRCEMLKWEWFDLAPSSMSGLGQMKVIGNTYYEGRSEISTIEIKAFGVEDYLMRPVVLVEGRYTGGEISRMKSSAYGSKWFEIGRFTVEAFSESQPGRYILETTEKFGELRMRLIQPSTVNWTGAAEGQGAKNGCAHNDPACFRTAPGSRKMIGYNAGISRLEMCRDCAADERTDVGCRDRCRARKRECLCYDYLKTGQTGHVSDEHLYGGHQAVVVKELTINNKSVNFGALAKDANRICAYQSESGNGQEQPGPRADIHYGNSQSEISNDVTDATFTNEVISRSAADYAVLNCNFAVPGEPGQIDPSRFAGLVVANPSVEVPLSSTIFETAGSGQCFIGPRGNKQACHVWENGDVNLDAVSTSKLLHQTLDFHPFTMFGPLPRCSNCPSAE